MISIVIDARTGSEYIIVNGRRYPRNLASIRHEMQCTPAQMRLTLHRIGMLQQVQNLADSDQDASIAWEYATEIIRNSQFIADLQGRSGLTDDEIDAIFIRAMSE